MMLMYIGLLASFVVYIYFRIRYTLKIAKDRKDRSADAQYTLSVYSIFTLCIEVLCMAAMALFSGAAPFHNPQLPRLLPGTQKGFQQSHPQRVCSQGLSLLDQPKAPG